MPKISELFLWPSQTPAKTLVDPWAFAVALIAGPLIPGILGAPLFLVPTVGVFLGGLPYLIIGAPILWAMIRRGRDHFARMGFLLNAIGGAFVVAAYFLLTWLSQDMDRALDTLVPAAMLWALAMVHGALWCSIFGQIYARLRNPNFPQTV